MPFYFKQEIQQIEISQLVPLQAWDIEFIFYIGIVKKKLKIDPAFHPEQQNLS